MLTYDAYPIEEIVSKLPVEASSISSGLNKETLFIGSKQGHLLCCSSYGGSQNYEYHVCRTFEKRPILKLNALDSHEVIFALTDTQLSVHHAAEPYRFIASFSKYKPISNFTCYVEKKDLFVLLSSKNNLIILKYSSNGGFGSTFTINLNDNALKIIWSSSKSLFIGFKHDYQFYKLFFTGAEGELMVEVPEPPKIISKQNVNQTENLPLIVELKEDGIVGLRRDDRIVDFFDAENGQIANGMNSCKFTDPIVELVYDRPYFVAILASNSIEIRSLNPLMLIQKITLNKVSMLSVGPRGIVYAANDTQAWKLNALMKLEENYERILMAKQFKLALEIADAYQTHIDSNKVIEVKKMMAANYFIQRKFSKCFDFHIHLNSDVLFVVNLLPQLVPEKYQKLSLRFRDELQKYEISQNPLSEADMKFAIQALIQYLSMKRTEHSKLITLHFLDYKEDKKEHLLTTNELKKHEASLELIDTILLKCYLQANPALVASLLRIKNCCCIISEAEKDLKQSKMFNELLLLYERKKMYRKYLELLQKHSKENEPAKRTEIEKIANFLMRLTEDQLPLILEFATLVLKEDIQLGVQIFTGNDDDSSSNAQHFNRDQILQFLKREFPDAIVAYLEHIIEKWKDDRPKFHEELLLQYLTQIRRMLGQYVKSLPDQQNTCVETSELKLMRKKLQMFLANDKQYTVQDAFKLIESDNNLLEEKAVLYGRLGKHSDALYIYTHVLMDFDAAERHCQLYYNDGKNPETAKLFYNLFHFYITGKSDNNRNTTPDAKVQKRQNITEALKLFRKYATKIDNVSAFSLIPPDTPLSRISGALKSVFESLNNRLNSVKMMLSLTNVAIEGTELNLRQIKKQQVHINERVECCICKKRIMESAFVRHRDSSLSHYFCYKTNSEQEKQNIGTSSTKHDKNSLAQATVVSS